MTIPTFPTNPTGEQKQRQRKAVLDSEVIYEWRCLMREKGKLFQTLGGCGIGLVIMAIFCIASQSLTPLIMFVPALIITTPMMYHLGSVDREYHGQITAKGIIEHKTKFIPDIFYKINRWMGYIGAVTCVLAAVFIGPAAFVGAGGFALMALVRGERKRATETTIKPWLLSEEYIQIKSSIQYQNSIRTHWYIVQKYLKTNKAGLGEVYFACSEKQYAEIDKKIRQHLNAVERTLSEEEKELNSHSQASS